MGDHRAGIAGPTATSRTAPPASSGAPGKRAARHAVEPRTSQPYAGRRVAAPAGRRIAPPPVLADDVDDVSGHFVASSATPVAPVAPTYTGRRIATPVILAPEVLEPVVTESPEPRTPQPRAVPWFELVEITPAPEVELVEVAPGPAVALVAPVEPIAPVVAEVAEVAEVVEAEPARVLTPRQTRPGGRRATTRRTRVPSLPLMAGVAVLAISAGGALQAMHPDLAGADAAGRLSAASALSGSGAATGTAGLVSSRGVPVSRSSDRTTDSQQAAADAQAKQRDEFLSALRGKAEAQSAKIRLHRWVLPVAPGVYHLTARFGDYSSLWANFHTGLDFAAPTGTPIMAVAGGVITEVGYSGAYGNRTIEKLPDGTELWYCHQNEFGTQVGAKVQPGQVIGYVGSTGNVTGPHLHLEVHPNGGDPVDPYPVLVDHGLYPGPPA
ncbi:MAG: peptidoglycan DD-metalloendopeptidase family protein [Nocardioides sp.]